MKYIKTINERLSSVLYHFTYPSNLDNILKNNTIYLGSSVGTRADNTIQAYKDEKPFGNPLEFKYPYFLSFSRTKDIEVGYQRTKSKSQMCRIQFDGNLLNHKYTGGSVDYWGQKDMVMINKINMSDADRKHRILADFEYEDRLFSKDDEIKNVNKYIIRIDILVLDIDLNDTNNNANLINTLISNIKHSNVLNIPIYIYNNKKDFNLQNKNIINNNLLDIGEVEYNDDNRPYISSYDSKINNSLLQKVFAILLYDKKLIEKCDIEFIGKNVLEILKKYGVEFELKHKDMTPQEFLNSISYHIHDNMRTIQYGGLDFIPSIESDIKNSTRNSTNKDNRTLVKILADFMRKKGVKTVKEIFDYYYSGKIRDKKIKYTDKKCFAIKDQEYDYDTQIWSDILKKIDNDIIVKDTDLIYFGTPWGISRQESDYMFDNYRDKTCGEFLNYLLNNHTTDRANEIINLMSNNQVVIADKTECV